METKTILSSDEMEDILLTCIVERAPCKLGNLNEIRDREGRTLLHWATKLGLREEVEYLLKQGMNPNIADDEGRTALHYAALIGDGAITRLLVEAGADVNARDRLGRVPLHYAKSPDVAKILILNGADVNVKDFAGNTPLHTVPEASEILLQYGADPNARNEKGLPPIYYALRRGVCKAALLLLSTMNHSLLNVVDEDGDTLLHLATRNGCKEVAEQLLKLNIDINAQNKYGDTPLHVACYADDVELIKLLLNNGANPHIQNKHGYAAWMCIASMCRNGNCIIEIVDYLKEESVINDFIKTVFHSDQLKLLRALLQRGLLYQVI